MKIPFTKTALAAAALFQFHAGNVFADATVVIQSTLFQTNLTSSGQPLDSSFTFELGCFANGFVPTSGNTDDWLVNWVPLSDAAGDPIPEATVQYDDSEAGDPFPPGNPVNFFEMSVPFNHNTPPFTTTTPFYIWGFNNREEPGTSEWILISDPNWLWPEATSSEPTQLTLTVSQPTTTTVVGTVNTGGVEMQTAAVTVITATLPPYELWLQQFFDEATLENESLMETVWGVLADPDNDEYSNIVEYYIGTSPTVELSRPEFTVFLDDGDYVFEFNRLEEAPGANGRVEWSTDLVNWSTDGLNEYINPGEEGEVNVQTAIEIPDEGRVFLRLWVERVLEE